MQKPKIFGSIVLACALFAGALPSRAAGCEDTIARHMVGEAMLAAQFVAAAEKNGMTADAINAGAQDALWWCGADPGSLETRRL